MRQVLRVLILAFLGCSSDAFAAQGMTYHGRIAKPNGQALEANNVFFRIQIRSPGNENCLLFDETQTLNMTGSNGVFVLTIGDGARAAANVDGGNSLQRIFANRGTIAGTVNPFTLSCAVGNTYSPNVADGRKLVVQFNDGSGWETLPTQNINFVPLALESTMISGYKKDQLVRAAEGVTTSELSQADWDELWDLITGASGTYAKTDGSNFNPSADVDFNGKKAVDLADPTGAQDAVTKNYADTKVGGKTADTSAVSNVAGNGKVLTWDQASNKWVASTVDDVTKLPLAGGTMTGAINMNSQSITNAGHVQIVAQGTLYLGRFTTAEQNTLVATPLNNTTDVGRTWYNTSTGKMMYWDGDSAEAVGSEAWVTSTVNSAISTASANYLYKDGSVALTADWDIDGAGAGTRKITGLADPSAADGAATKAYVDAAISGGGSTKFMTKDLPAVPAAAQTGQALRYNDTSGDWEFFTPSTGTVTSVGAGTGIDIGGTAAAPTVVLEDTAVTPASYGSATGVATFTVDQQGRLTAAATTAIAITPDQVVNGAAKYFSYKPNNSACADGEILKWDNANTRWICGAVTSSNVTTALGYTPVNKAGDTMTGLLVLSADPSANLGAATKQYVDGAVTAASGLFVKHDGTVALSADWDADGAGAGTRKITGLAAPTASDGAATKGYADTKLIGATLPAAPAAGQNGQALRWNNAGTAWEYFTPSTGTVTSVTGGVALTNSGTATDPVLDLDDTAVTPAAYGSASSVATFTVDQQGRLTAAASTAIDIKPDQISNGAGKYFSYAPNNTQCADGQVLKWDDTNDRWICASDAGAAGVVASVTAGTGVSLTGTATDPVVNLANTAVTPAAYGSASSVATFTVDQQGRLTAAASTSIDIKPDQISNGAGKYFGYKPNNSACSDGQYLEWDNANSRWVCGSVSSSEVTAALGYTPVNKAGDTMSGALAMGTNKITGLGDPTAAQEAATKNYVDTEISAGAATKFMTKDLPAVPAAAQTGQALRYNDTSGDWEFFTPSTGTVTSVSAGTGIDIGGTAAAPSVILEDTAVTPAAYGSATGVATFTVDQQGRLTAAATTAIAITPDQVVSGAAKYFAYKPNNAACADGEFLKWDNTNTRWICGTPAAVTSADVTTALGYTPVNKAGDTMTGLLVLSADPSANLGAATKQYVDGAITTAGGAYVKHDGTVALSTDWDADGAGAGTRKITGLASPTASDGAATKGYVDALTITPDKVVSGAGKYFSYAPNNTQCADGQVLKWDDTNDRWICGTDSSTDGSLYLQKDGSVALTADWDADGAGAGTRKITGLAAPTASDGAATKGYADTKLIGATLPAAPGAGQNGQALRWNNGGTAWEYFTPSTGSVTSVTGGVGLTAGGTAADPVLDLDDTAVTPAAYGSASSVATFTVDQQGRLTAAASTAIDIKPDQISNGAGKYFGYKPNNTACGDGEILKWDNANSRWICGTDAGAAGLVASVTAGTGVSLTGTATDPVVNLADTAVVAASYGSATQVATFTVDAKGRLTAAASTAIAITPDQVVNGASKYFAYKPNNTACADGEILKWDNTNTRWICSTVASSLGFTPVNKAGDTMTGLLVLSADPSANLGASTKQYVDSAISTAGGTYLKKDGTVALTADWDIDGGSAGTLKLTGLAAPTASDGAVTKGYADGYLATRSIAAAAAGNNGQSIRYNSGSSSWEYFTPATGTGDFLRDGTLAMTGNLRLGSQWLSNDGGSEGLRVDNSGNVGVQQASPRAVLDVNGTVLFKAAVSNATSTIDFSTGNLQYTTSNCAAYALHNMKDGGSYTFAVQGGTSTTCSFTAYSDAGSSALTVKMPPDHAATTASKHTMYTFLVMGSTVYVSWLPGI